MERVFGVFYHRVACTLTENQPWKRQDGGWVYPPLKGVMAEANLQEVET